MDENAIVPRSEFNEMDTRDEAQILLNLKGGFLEEFVYEFYVEGKKTTGISWSGIKEIAYRIGEIETELVKYEETETHHTFMIKAINKGIGSRLGIYSQPKIFTSGKRKGQINDFALQTALSKAQRNAIRGVIPEATIKTYIEMFKNEGRVDNTPPPRREVQSETKEKPKAKAKPKAQPTINSNSLDEQVELLRGYGVAERTQNESDYRWSCEEEDVEAVATALPEPFVGLLAGRVSKDPTELLKVSMYQNTPVIQTKLKLTNEDWSAINAAFYDVGLRWCTGGKASHWFAPPIENL